MINKISFPSTSMRFYQTKRFFTNLQLFLLDCLIQISSYNGLIDDDDDEDDDFKKPVKKLRTSGQVCLVVFTV